MVNADVLEKYGISYKSGLERFLGDEKLYEMVLRAYASDDVVQRARAAFDGKEKNALLGAVHEAKGSCGNANLSDVYQDASAVVNLLRSDNYTEMQLQEAFCQFENSYLKSQNAVRLALSEG